MKTKNSVCFYSRSMNSTPRFRSDLIGDVILQTIFNYTFIQNMCVALASILKYIKLFKFRETLTHLLINTKKIILKNYSQGIHVNLVNTILKSFFFQHLGFQF